MLETARQADPDNVTVLNNLAGAYVRLGKSKDAEPLLLHALEVDPRKHTTYINLASWYLNEGRYHTALKYANEAVAKAPWINTTHRVRIMVLARMKRYDDARSAIDDAEKALPNSPFWRQFRQQLPDSRPNAPNK